MVTKKIMLSLAPQVEGQIREVATARGLALSALTSTLYEQEYRRWKSEQRIIAPKKSAEKKSIGRPRHSEELKMCRKIADELQEMFNRKKATQPEKYQGWYRHYEIEMHRILQAEDAVKMASYSKMHPWWKPPALDAEGNYYYVPPADGKPIGCWNGLAVSGQPALGGDGEIPEDVPLS